MPSRKKSRTEIASQAYLSKSDIAHLFGVSFPKAKKIYDYAMQIDSEELKYKIEDTKVRMSSIQRVYGISATQLKKMVE